MAKKKAETKKTAAKKTTAKPKGLAQAPAEHYFVLVDGRTLKDVKELADVLEDMHENTWGHHVNNERNDFANWVNDIFKEEELARQIRESQGKHHLQIVLYRHILDRL